jgi:hypothetical protein
MARDVKSALPDPTPLPLPAPGAVTEPERQKPEKSRRLGRVRDTSRAERARKSAYRSRFVLVYFALAIALGGAVGALIVALNSSKSTQPKKAAAFVPTGSGEIGALQIANRVQSLYRLSNGLPVAEIIASRNSLQDGSGGLIRVRFQVVQAADAQSLKDSRTIFPQDALQYSLCGAGPVCSIPGGASRARGSLLRREGLELALRTFQRDSQVDNVVVFLRPFSAPQGWEGVALMFDRASMSRNTPNLLTRPITDSVPGFGRKLTPTQMTPNDIAKINELTQPYLFVYRYQTIGGRDAILQLEPPS